MDWPSFHRLSKAAFGFPDFYGMNLDAWIDCLTYLYEDDGMSQVKLRPGEQLEIRVASSAGLRARWPELVDTLGDVVSAVNTRHHEDGYAPGLRLVFT